MIPSLSSFFLHPFVCPPHRHQDHTGNEAVQGDLDRCKTELNVQLQVDAVLMPETIDSLSPAGQQSVRRALANMQNPREKLVRMHKTIGELVAQVKN
jgi:hypothetical protein